MSELPEFQTHDFLVPVLRSTPKHTSTRVQIIVVLDLGHIYLSFRESVLCTLEFGIEFILVFKNSYSDYGKYCGPHYGA
jgi:hypothetical protein